MACPSWHFAKFVLAFCVSGLSMMCIRSWMLLWSSARYADVSQLPSENSNSTTQLLWWSYYKICFIALEYCVMCTDEVEETRMHTGNKSKITKWENIWNSQTKDQRSQLRWPRLTCKPWNGHIRRLPNKWQCFKWMRKGSVENRGLALSAQLIIYNPFSKKCWYNSWNRLQQSPPPSPHNPEVGKMDE